MSRRALAIALGALLASTAACKQVAEPRVARVDALADSADQVMFGVSTIITDRGLLRAQLQADTAYFFESNSRIEVRHDTVKFYGNTGEQTAVLTSREGTYSTTRGTMEARKNVVVNTTDGRHLETEQLRYNQTTNLISSDSAFQMTDTSGRVLTGVGFVSDPDLKNIKVDSVRSGTGTFTLPGQGTPAASGMPAEGAPAAESAAAPAPRTAPPAARTAPAPRGATRAPAKPVTGTIPLRPTAPRDTTRRPPTAPRDTTRRLPAAPPPTPPPPSPGPRGDGGPS